MVYYYFPISYICIIFAFFYYAQLSSSYMSDFTICNINFLRLCVLCNDIIFLQQFLKIYFHWGTSNPG